GPDLRFLLDRSALQRIDALFDADLVDGADPPEQAAERIADRARPPIPRTDELVRALPREGVGALRGGHGTDRIRRRQSRVVGSTLQVRSTTAIHVALSVQPVRPSFRS